MRDNKFRNKTYKRQLIGFFLASFFALLNFSAQAQSTNQSFPTIVTTSEISGQIAARDIGDARLTSYFYTFNAGQGDVFINVVTRNFNGDIDLFTADNLRPLTKISVYADAGEKETGRVVYLRQPEKLILRVEGRTPNDEAATFRIKFAGSFEPLPLSAEVETPETPVVKSENQTDVRVNSVGTIIEIKPKVAPTPKEKVASVKTNDDEEKIEENKQATENAEKNNKTAANNAADKKNAKVKEKSVKSKKTSVPTLIIADTLAEKETKEESETKKDEISENETEITETKKESPVKASKTTAEKGKSKTSVKAVAPAELANIKLVILFKDGSIIERPMSEILRFSVDKGILVVVSKDGAIGRYSILDVERTTIE